MATLVGSINPVCIDVQQAAEKLPLLERMGYQRDATLVILSTVKDGLTADGVRSQLQEMGHQVSVEAFDLTGEGRGQVEIVIRRAA